MMYCNYAWWEPRQLVNTAGIPFETLPVAHICTERLDHEGQHNCPCGGSKENDVIRG